MPQTSTVTGGKHGETWRRKPTWRRREGLIYSQSRVPGPHVSVVLRLRAIGRGEQHCSGLIISEADWSLAAHLVGATASPRPHPLTRFYAVDSCPRALNNSSPFGFALSCQPLGHLLRLSGAWRYLPRHTA
jgi:hypothetical protein